MREQRRERAIKEEREGGGREEGEERGIKGKGDVRRDVCYHEDLYDFSVWSSAVLLHSQESSGPTAVHKNGCTNSTSQLNFVFIVEKWYND